MCHKAPCKAPCPELAALPLTQPGPACSMGLLERICTEICPAHGQEILETNIQCTALPTEGTLGAGKRCRGPQSFRRGPL